MKHFAKTLVKITALSALTMYAANKFIESAACAWHLLTTNRGNQYEWRYGKIFYKKLGSGDPLLLIHDLDPASSMQEWDNVIESLAKDHTVYALDLLGCGRSDKPNLTYSNYLYVQMISDFIQNIIKGKTDVFSTGKSNSTVITAANMHPELFGRLMLVNPEGLGKTAVCPGMRSKIAKKILYCPILGTFVYYMLNSRAQLEYNFAESYYYNPFHLADKTIRTYYESAHLSAGRGRYLLGSLKGNYLNFDIRHALGNLTVPVCLLFGSKFENAEKIAASYQKINPNIQCASIPNTKMLPQLEAPQQFLLVLNKYLTSSDV